MSPVVSVPDGVTLDTPELLDALRDRLVQPRPDCMLWVDPNQQGYGSLQIAGRAYLVHRLFWELINGPIPDGLTVDHLCRVRSCCNTDHMEIVTGGENARRHRVPVVRLLHKTRTPGVYTTRKPADNCRRGHVYDEVGFRIAADGTRRCRACSAAHEAARPPRKRNRAKK